MAQQYVGGGSSTKIPFIGNVWKKKTPVAPRKARKAAPSQQHTTKKKATSTKSSGSSSAKQERFLRHFKALKNPSSAQISTYERLTGKKYLTPKSSGSTGGSTGAKKTTSARKSTSATKTTTTAKPKETQAQKRARFLRHFKALKKPSAAQIKTWETITGKKYKAPTEEKKKTTTDKKKTTTDKKKTTVKVDTDKQALEKKRQAMERTLKKNSDSYYDTQQGALQKARDSHIAELDKALGNAKAEGETLKTEANSQFDDASEQIYDSAYLDSQRTSLYANEAGIQNSQQMLGLRAGDNARTNSLVSEATSARDQRINEIQTRIANLSSQRDIDVATANSNYDSNLIVARGTADQMYNDGLLAIQRDDYNTDKQEYLNKIAQQREQEYKKDLMEIENKYKLGLISEEHKNALDLQAREIAAEKARQDAELAAQREAQQRQLAAQRSMASYSTRSPGGGSTGTLSSTQSKVSQQYQNYQKAKTTTPTDNYYNSMTKQYNFPIGTRQSYIDNFHKKYTPPPAKNGLLNAWEKSQAMFGRN